MAAFRARLPFSSTVDGLVRFSSVVCQLPRSLREDRHRKPLIFGRLRDDITRHVLDKRDQGDWWWMCRRSELEAVGSVSARENQNGACPQVSCACQIRMARARKCKLVYGACHSDETQIQSWKSPFTFRHNNHIENLRRAREKIRKCGRTSVEQVIRVPTARCRCTPEAATFTCVTRVRACAEPRAS